MLPEEYREYLRENTTALERLGDKLTTTDERIDYVVLQLERVLAGGIPSEVQARLELLRNSIDTLISMLREKEMLVGESTQVRFQETLQPLTGDRFTQDCPYDAVITSICFHFPPGCSALVDVAVGHGEKQCYPREGSIALDAATPVFNINELVNRDETLWCEIRNGDSVNPHTITVILTLQERV